MLLLRWACQGHHFILNNISGIGVRVNRGVGSVRNNSQFYRPKQQKEAFFDVEHSILNTVRGIGARVSRGVGSVRNNSSQFYRPKQQKEAFFDVEGVVTKDTLLFRYEDVNSVRRKNFVAMAMLPLWAYLGNNL
jgi:CRISPR/Cas system CMR-associated protein Cmr1 (group 7 of RAMP superfamily)